MATFTKLDKEHNLLVMDNKSIRIDGDDGRTVSLSSWSAGLLAQCLMDWKRVEDALPDDEIEVLAYMQASDCFIMASRDDGHWISTDNGMRLHGITHWCDPIPPVGRVS